MPPNIRNVFFRSVTVLALKKRSDTLIDYVTALELHPISGFDDGVDCGYTD